MERFIRTPNIVKFNIIMNACVYSKYLQDLYYAKLYAGAEHVSTVYKRGKASRKYNGKVKNFPVKLYILK